MVWRVSDRAREPPAAMVASRAGSIVRAAILADPTFLSPERQREVFDSDVGTWPVPLRFLPLW